MKISSVRGNVATSKILEMLDTISGKWQEFRANGTPCIRLVV